MFEIKKTSSFDLDSITVGNEYDYVTRTSMNQGILSTSGFVNNGNINESGTWSLGLMQMDFFYRKKNWYAGQFVRKIVPKDIIKNKATSFFTVVLNMLKPILLNVLVRNVDNTFMNLYIKLPIKNGMIDFDFMEYFVDKIESMHTKELKAYLTVTGLKDYELTDEEKESISLFDNITWQEFKMDNLFERIRTKKLPYKARELPNSPTGDYTLPCLTSSFMNQGLNYYAPRKDTTILKNVISIPSNSDVYRAYFQSREFTVLSDAYAIRWVFEDKNLTNNQYLFTVQSINKVTDLPIYSYKNKLGGWNVVKEKNIVLPVKNKKPDYEYMDTFINAIKKLAIKEFVQWIEKK